MSEGQNALPSPDLTDRGRHSSGSGLVLGSRLLASAFNCGCLTQSKQALLVRSFSNFKLDLLVLTEIGQRKFELAGQSGWITSTVPTSRNGGVAMMLTLRLKRLIQCDLKVSAQITCKRRIIIGDLNATVARNCPGITGQFGLHHYHSRNGRLLAHFC